MVELRHLRYFVAVAEELNFSRAAERLHMAQAPLSVPIRQLEQELGTELLTRTTRDVSLTDAGRTFLEGARATLAELDRSVVDARRASSGELGCLRIAFSWGTRFVTLPALGKAFRSTHPDVKLLTEEMWNSRMPGALRAGLVDLAVSLCPEVSGELSYETIRSEGVVALLTRGHSLAGEEEIALDALAAEQFVLFPRELAPRLYDSLVGLCRRAGVRTEDPKRVVSHELGGGGARGCAGRGAGAGIRCARHAAGARLGPAQRARRAARHGPALAPRCDAGARRRAQGDRARSVRAAARARIAARSYTRSV